jgi:hypothetical protein
MQDFTGIAEKLKRAEENIFNLYAEMERFFHECDYPVLPQDDSKLLLQAIEYHKNLVIPPRFGVLVGEINHQLRSCFDHIVWCFSLGSVQNIKNIRQIEFPVFEARPANHESRALFERKVQGITDPNVRALIEQLQPYNAADPLDDPLWIIHDFDIVDRHRELIFCVGTGSTVFPREMQGILETYQREHPELDSAQVARHFKSDGSTQPCISFRNFGRRGVKAVTEGLIELFNYTIRVAGDFRDI